MRFRVLGSLDVVRDGRPSAPRIGKERAILARLLLDAGRPVPVDALLEAGWPASPRAGARSLSVRLAALRSFLEPDRKRGAPSTLLLREGSGYRLAIAPDQVDAHHFERLVDQALTAAAPSLTTFDEALALWRGAPFEDLADLAAAQPEIRRLEELHLRAQAGRARALVELGRHEEALPELRRLAESEPQDEELARALAIALYRCGRQVEALEVLRALRSHLIELGLEPGPESGELERRILVHDPALAAGGQQPRPATVATVAQGKPAPRRASRFFGRESELALAERLLGEHGLVTLTGMGGTGKTRLTIELSGRLADRFPDGLWWCDLAPIRLDEDVPGVIAEAVGIELAAGGAGLDHIVTHLADRSTLLVLDNCEHVLDSTAAAVERLLAMPSGPRILATSRAPLGVDGERVLQLGGLDPGGSAVELFTDRAQATGADIDLERESAAIEDICRRVDGLPLAIELAAGRTRSMTPTEVAERLAESFGLLAVPGRRASERHDTLETAIDWSYNLLEEPERRVFERLAVFHHGCTLTAAEEVCAGDGIEREEVADLLDRLVAHSMVFAVQAEGVTRFDMQETLWEYAESRLEERAEHAAVRDRHVDHYVRRVQRVAEDFAGWRDPTLPLADDFCDLREALRWCVASDSGPDRAFELLLPLWATAHSTHAHEIAELAELALTRWPDTDHPLRPAALGTAATARLVMGDQEAARRHADEAVALEQPSAGVAPALVARRVRALVEIASRDFEGALATLSTISERARAGGNLPLAVDVDGFRAQALEVTGRHDEAVELATRMRADALQADIDFSTRWALYVSGVLELDHDPEASRAWLDECLGELPPDCQHNVAHFAERALAVVDLLEGRGDLGAGRLLAALERDEAAADEAQQWLTLAAIALLLATRRRTEAAASLVAAVEEARSAPSVDVVESIVRDRARAEVGAAARTLAPPRDLRAARSLARTELEHVAHPVRDDRSREAVPWT